MATRRRAPLDRLREKYVTDEAGCWLWTASLTHNGYGRFKMDGRMLTAHRVSYELLVGPIPAGLTLDHLCRVRHCVNPGHLEPVTLRENLLRGDTLQARNAAKTHCDHGHPLTEENTRRYRGKRQCKTCQRKFTREWMRGYRARISQESENA